MTINPPVGPRPSTLAACLRGMFLVDEDPPDSGYRERYAAETIEGFRVLSFLTFASMAVLLVVHLMQLNAVAPGTNEGPTAIACMLLTCAGAVGFLVSNSIRAPNTAFLTTAALLVAAVTVLSADRLQQVAREARSVSSLVPIIFSILAVSAALLPLRPRRMLCLGALVAASAGLTAGVMKVPFRADFFDLASTATVIIVSVAIAARSTSHRIRIHQAHVSAMASEREAKAARERALLAESAITMERLAASLSHELNTPIGVLKSSTETLVRGIRKNAVFANGNRLSSILDGLSRAIDESAARLSETLARIQRFANLDRSAVRLVDINQLVQDAVALMNPPSANQALVKLTLRPLPQVWCKPHGLGVAVASILNTALDNSLPATIETYSEGTSAVVRVACHVRAPELQQQASPGFAVVAGRVRATGWDLFAARQLVRETGGELRVNRVGGPEQVVTITLPIDVTLLDEALRPAASVDVA